MIRTYKQVVSLLRTTMYVYLYVMWFGDDIVTKSCMFLNNISLLAKTYGT